MRDDLREPRRGPPHPRRRDDLEPRTSTDQDAIRRCLAGERDAFGELVERWQDRIYGAIYRIVWDAETARDLAQETFLRAYTKLESFQGGAAFGTWLYSIALNQARSELRRRSAAKNKPPLSLDSMRGQGGEAREMDPADNAAPSPVDTIATREHCELLRAEIERLDPLYREVLVMREFQNLSYEEVAEAVGVPVGTVRSRLHRARRDLRDRLKDRVL